MVTLPPTLSNQLCHSLNAVRVKGGTTWKCDAGDTFITGCPVTRAEIPFQYMTHSKTVKTLFQQHKFAAAKQLGRVTNYCSEDVIHFWHSLRSIAVVSERMKPSSSLKMSLPSLLSIYPFCFPSFHLSFPVSVFWMAVAVKFSDKLFPGKRTKPRGPAEPSSLISSGLPTPPPTYTPTPISDELVLVSRRRRTTISPIVLH